MCSKFAAASRASVVSGILFVVCVAGTVEGMERVEIVDNEDPRAFAVDGRWKHWTKGDPYGGTSRIANYNGTFVFAPELPAGRYRVSLTWIATRYVPRRAPVFVDAVDGVHPFTVNQQRDGGVWNVIGEFDLDESSRVRLVAPRRFYICADAVKFELLSEPESPPDPDVLAEPDVPAEPDALPPPEPPQEPTPTPPAPPAPPLGLVAAAGTDAIDLDWDDNVEADLTGYRVYRSTGGDFELIAQVASSEYRDASAPLGVTGFYVVTATDDEGLESEPSVEASATIVDEPPRRPTSLVATWDGSGVALDWDDNTEADLAGYAVYRSSVADGEYFLLAELAASAYLDLDVDSGASYFYLVTAMDAAENESASSDVASVMAPPELRTGRVAWNSPTLRADGSGLDNLQGFNVHVRSLESGATIATTSVGLVNAHTLAPLPLGAYVVTVIAYDASGLQSDDSEELVLTFE